MPTNEPRDPVSITGMGVATPLGLTVPDVWARVVRGDCGIGPVPAMEQPLPPNADGGQATELPADFHPGLPREARYLRWSIDAAWRQAGLDARVAGGARIALILGTTLHGMRAAGRYLRSNDLSELKTFLSGDTLDLAAQHLPIHGLRTTTCSACSSSLGAIALGATWLAAGHADVVLAGGYDPVSEYAWAGFHSLRVVSTPPLRPFTRGREGMKLSEAYAIVALERANDAGARALVQVAGWGESADAFHLTRPEPAGRGALAAMREALHRAAITPSDLGLIAAHATGTPDNDASEAAALSELLGHARPPVVGFKSHLGHTLGGAGATELILSAAAMRAGMVPPCANTNATGIEFPTLHVATSAEPREIRYSLNTSLGFGGANTCVVLAQADRQNHRQEPHVTTRAEPLARDVVITGIGVLLPGAIGNDAFLSTPALRGATLEDAEFEHLVAARRARRMSPYVRYQLAAATLAFAHAGLAEQPDLRRVTSALLATAHGSTSYCHDYYAQVVREGLLSANPVLFAEGVPNAAAAQVSLMLGLQGGCQTLIGSPTTGAEALALATARISTGACDRILLGAAEEAHPSIDAARHHCNPASKPSASGAVAFVLESLPVATARGATFLAKFPDPAPGHPAPPPIPYDLYSVTPLLRLARTLLSAPPPSPTS